MALSVPRSSRRQCRGAGARGARRTGLCTRLRRKSARGSRPPRVGAGGAACTNLGHSVLPFKQQNEGAGASPHRPCPEFPPRCTPATRGERTRRPGLPGAARGEPVRLRAAAATCPLSPGSPRGPALRGRPFCPSHRSAHLASARGLAICSRGTCVPDFPGTSLSLRGGRGPDGDPTGSGGCTDAPGTAGGAPTSVAETGSPRGADFPRERRCPVQEKHDQYLIRKEVCV